MEDSPDRPGRARALRQLLRGAWPRRVALGLLLVTLACVIIPLSPVMPGPKLDEAWALGINQALSQGLAIGEDLYFTFGPYSALFSMAYHPATDGMVLISSAYLTLCYWLALVELTRDARGYLPWVLALLFASVLSGRDARDTILLAYPLLVGLVCVRTAARAPDRRALAITAVLCSAFGLLPQIKGSMAGTCGLVGAVVIGLFALERRWRLAIAVAAAPLVGLIVFWKLAGQPFAGLVGYFRTLSPIISGYADAMGIPGDPWDIALYLIGCAGLLAAVLWQRDAPRRTRRFEAAVFLVFLFVAFKAGFIRHDSHALIPAQGLLLAAVLFAGLASSRWKLVVLAAAVLAWGQVDRHHVRTSPGSLAERVRTTYAAGLRGLGLRLGSDGPEPEFHATLRAIAGAYGVRPLEGTTDVYSSGQTALIASGLRWSPRPTMQSYVAYDASLAASNRDHLRGARAPDNVLFKVEPFDARLPALDDGASWPALLARYRPIGFERDFLILRRRPAAAGIDEPQPLEGQRGLIGRLGKAVPVPAADGLVIAEIDVRPSILGRVAGALFKVEPLVITFKLAGGQVKSYRYAAVGGRIGLPLSPLIESTSEFAALYAGTSLVRAKRVESFTIHPSGADLPWRRRFHVTWKRVPLAPTGTPRQAYELEHGGRELDALVAEGVEPGAVTSIKCEGVIDVLDGFSPAPGQLFASGLVSVAGWVTRSVKPPVVSRAVLVVLTDRAGRHLLFRTRPVLRADVARHFSEPALEASGYTAMLDLSRYEGTYALGIALQDGAAVERCEESRYTIELRAATPP